MPEISKKELKESIEELTAYRNRLHEEVIKMAQKLKMPKKKLELTLKQHLELQNIDKILTRLIKMYKDKNILS